MRGESVEVLQLQPPPTQTVTEFVNWPRSPPSNPSANKAPQTVGMAVGVEGAVRVGVTVRVGVRVFVAPTVFVGGTVVVVCVGAVGVMVAVGQVSPDVTRMSSICQPIPAKELSVPSLKRKRKL